MSGLVEAGSAVPAVPDVITDSSTLSNGPTETSQRSALAQTPLKHKHIWLITGPGGCGKTTVAEYLADSMGMPYIEGDSVCHAASLDWFLARPSLLTS